MADGTKKYRQVFDRYETTYLRVELSFFNKAFDEEDWTTSITLKCLSVNGSQSRELCTTTETVKVLKEDNIVYFRYSWGNDTPGGYWRKGNYLWEASIDGAKIGEGYFYIEDAGQAATSESLFFDIESIRLFEGDAKASSLPDKKYLSQFNKSQTRYVWGEFTLKNKNAVDYYAELFFNFYDDAGQPKGRSTRLLYIPANTVGTLYTTYPSWGSDEPAIWIDDSYTMEVVFLDRLIATVPFKVGDQFVEGAVAMVAGDQLLQPAATASGPRADQKLEDLLHESLAELNALTGLSQVKAEVNEMVKLVRYYQETGKNVLNKFSLHTVFTGNPGTGKTTVARILSRIYKGLGILEKGHLVEVDRQGLVAGYVGQTAIKTGEKITEAMGGILFIDEAYSLANESGSQHDFGGESIQVILKRMEDNRGKFGVIVAGYTDKMEEFINSNPGLRSRFDKYFYFEDYTPEEMFRIALSQFSKEECQPDDHASQHLRGYFAALYEKRDENFGNARTVRQVVAESVRNQNLRLASMKKEERTPAMIATVTLDDVREFVIREDSHGSHPIGFQVGGQ